VGKVGKSRGERTRKKGRVGGQNFSSGRRVGQNTNGPNGLKRLKRDLAKARTIGGGGNPVAGPKRKKKKKKRISLEGGNDR